MIHAQYSNSKNVTAQALAAQDFATPAEVGRLDALDGMDCRPSMYFRQPRQVQEYVTGWLEAQAEPSVEVLENVDDIISFNQWGDRVVGI